LIERRGCANGKISEVKIAKTLSVGIDDLIKWRYEETN